MVGGWGGVGKVIFMSNLTVVLRLGWGFDNKLHCKTLHIMKRYKDSKEDLSHILNEVKSSSGLS